MEVEKEIYECVKKCACDDTLRVDSYTRRGSFTSTMYNTFTLKLIDDLQKEIAELKEINEKLRKKKFCCF